MQILNEEQAITILATIQKAIKAQGYAKIKINNKIIMTIDFKGDKK